MSKAYPYMIQGNNIVVVIDNKPYTVSKTHVTYNRVLTAIKAGDWDTVKDVIDPKKVVLDYGQGNVSVQGDKLFWKGAELHTSLSKRMIQMLQDGFPIEPLVAFMENLMLNPSKRSVTELYGFLEKNTLPITPDGYFLAYKKVRFDYMDVHSGKCLNKPAYLMTDEEKAGYTSENGVTVAVENQDGVDVTVLSMERNAVDDDQNRTCSEGLHFCSKDYLNHFGGERIVIVKINPRDVVSIPNDYNDSKGRASRYEIVDEVDKAKADEAFAKVVQAEAEREASIAAEKDLATFIRATKLAAKEAAVEAAKAKS